MDRYKYIDKADENSLQVRHWYRVVDRMGSDHVVEDYKREFLSTYPDVLLIRYGIQVPENFAQVFEWTKTRNGIREPWTDRQIKRSINDRFRNRRNRAMRDVVRLGDGGFAQHHDVEAFLEGKPECAIIFLVLKEPFH